MGLCTRYIKHQYLVENCYPYPPGDISPKSSELSYLTFYASSRPAKLTKVGRYLEKKVRLSTYKGRIDETLVSLEILKSLVQTCKRDLNLFSKQVVSIIQVVLCTKDIKLLPKAYGMFVLFTSIIRGSTFSADSDITETYVQLIRNFSDLSLNNSGVEENMRIRILALRALRAAVSSEILYSSAPTEQLIPILSSVLSIIIGSNESMEKFQEREDAETKEDLFSEESEEDTEEELQIQAMRVLKTLFVNSNAVVIRCSLDSTFKFLDGQGKWYPNEFGVELMRLLVKCFQPQYRYMLISDIVQRLDEGVEGALFNAKNVTLVAMLDTLLSSQYSFPGLSVLEILGSLVNFLMNSLKEHDLEENESDNSIIQRRIHCGLVQSIGALAKHVYYYSQVNDIISHLISKLRVNVSLDEVDGIPIWRLRSSVLKCLLLVVLTNYNASTTTDEVEEGVGTVRAPLSFEFWTPAICLISCRNVRVRLEFMQAVITLLYSQLAKKTADKKISTSQTFSENVPINSAFRTTLHDAIVEFTCLDYILPCDIMAIQGLLEVLLFYYGQDEAIKCVPLLFKLQDFAMEIHDDFLRQRAIATLTLLHLDKIAEIISSSLLRNYVSGIRYARVERGEWMDGLEYRNLQTGPWFEASATNCAMAEIGWRGFDGGEASRRNMTVWFTRDAVRNAMLYDSRIVDQEGMLEYALDLEFGNTREIGSRKKNSFRANSHRNSSESKLRVSTISFERVDSPQLVKVDDLRRALSGEISSPPSERSSIAGVSDGAESGNGFYDLQQESQLQQTRQRTSNDDVRDLNDLLNSITVETLE
ncbi:uncharacterized protein VTP21DRAFT_8383 [Calcarisporiella thermophila]|uniref:uncharacterized protein n=1 Tax=Calcarisporiella thermophila TaxID=911321 RepID=UPI00374424E2